LDYDKTLPHREQRQQLADLYTAEIEKVLKDYPLQWFNYFNIWEDE
jgi:predicted LPLAT superfamily acyltransferase